jgi:hypothetical protein
MLVAMGLLTTAGPAAAQASGAFASHVRGQPLQVGAPTRTDERHSRLTQATAGKGVKALF